MIRVLVVDDHPIVRQGLVSVLGDEEDLEVVGEAGTGREAVARVARLQPDVVLLDLEMPDLDGVHAIPQLLALRPGLGIVVFTAYDTDERVLGAVRAGARGYLLKGASAEEIARGIRAVHNDGSYLEPRVASKLIAEVSSPRRGALVLSPREHEVLRLVAEGLPTKQISVSLSISERTVKFHVNSILRKLGADNRAQAVALAAQRGLL
ncbi:MAG: response regulator transcription factor [Chloroflexi bacterium]|nr:response regulator transcription factor [Chloroflexota bacterium]